MKCPVCSATNGIDLLVKEGMFSCKDIYQYVECSNCKTLYINQKVNQIQYPKYYYSINRDLNNRNILFNFLKSRRMNFYLFGQDFLGFCLNIIFPLDFKRYFWLKQANCTGYNIDILDVGCGNGFLLKELYQLGFTHLTGIDPFSKAEKFATNFQIKCVDIYNLFQTFDLIMFHHSFEHMENPKKALLKVKSLLSDTGKLIIRMPIKDTYAWNHYKENWVQIDAPRHKFILSKHYFNEFFESNGFIIEYFYYDSKSFQFWGSELLRKSIPIYSKSNSGQNLNKKLFPKDELRKFENHSQLLNTSDNGDQIALILKKKR